MAKDPQNCPICEAEASSDGASVGWGYSLEGWEMVAKRHKEDHKD